MQLNLREAILKKCFRPYEGTFKNGETANNKLEMEHIEESPLLRSFVIEALAANIMPYRADTLVSIPKGGDWLTIDVAHQLGAAAVLLSKDETTGAFSHAADSQEYIEASKRLIIIDDVLNKLTSASEVYSLPGIAERTVALAAVWDRNPQRQTVLPVRVEALVVEAIPAVLDESSDLWSYAA